MVQNPNWPRIVDAMSFINGPSTPIGQVTAWSDITLRGRASDAFSGGRQYETDTVRAGTRATTLDSPDSALDPTNPNSMFAPNVLLKRAWRRTAQYPTTSNNLFSPDQATAGSYSGLASGTVIGTNGNAPVFISDAFGFLCSHSDLDSNAEILTVTDGPNSSCPNVYQVSVPASTSAAAGALIAIGTVALTPGATYTLQARIRSTTSGVSPKVAVQLNWTTSAGHPSSGGVGTTVTLTGASGTWSLVTVTATAPTTGTVFGVKAAVILGATSPASTTMFQISALKIAKESSASAWDLPGPIYAVSTTYTERLPQRYSATGGYTQVDATATDMLGVFAKPTLTDAFGNAIMQYAPSFYYRLDDAAGSTIAADYAGQRRAALVTNSSFGVGSWVFGSSVTSAAAADLPLGIQGSVATLANPAGGGSQPETYLDLTAGGANPGGPGAATGSGSWTRTIAFRCPAVPALANYLWCASTASAATMILGLVSQSGAGVLTLTLLTAVGTGQLLYTGTSNLCDGNWHLIVLSASPTGVTLYVDGMSVATTPHGPLIAASTTDLVGCFALPFTSLFELGFNGDVGHIAELPVALTTAQVADLWQGFSTAYAGELSGLRWSRIAQWCVPGVQVVADPGSTIMGPATGVLGEYGLDAMTDVVTTENGQMWVNSWGIPRFAGRTSRYDQTTPMVVFGERTDLGELPYEPGTGFDFDLTRVFSQAQITQQPSGNVYSAQDARVPLPYGPNILQVDSWALSSGECQDAADYYVGRYKDPALRVNAIVLHPGANPALWAMCLQLDQGSRIRVMRRPMGGNPIAWDGYVEKLDWRFSPADATLTMQASPADPVTYWLLGAATTTLVGTTTVPAGTTTLFVNQLGSVFLGGGFAVGQRLTIDPGLSSAETVTVVGTPATNVAVTAGHLAVTYVVIVVTPTQFAHGANAQVTTGIPNLLSPGSWMQYSQLDFTTRLGY